MNQTELAQLHDEARKELTKIPGVIGVGYGFKQTGGEFTDVVGLIVWVKEKKDKSQLRMDEIIPPEFKGFATDVLTYEAPTPIDCEDHTTHSLLAGGITITSELRRDSGTLGFFATVDGKPGPHNVVLVTASHVFTDNGSILNAQVYQPSLVQQGTNWVFDAQHGSQENSIGHISNLGEQRTLEYTYPGEPPGHYHIDCATVEIGFCVSTWCHTFCGQNFTDQVLHLNDDGRLSADKSNSIADVDRVKHDDIKPNTPYVVYKVGRKTGRTVGRVISTGFPVADGTNMGDAIQILVTEPDCTGTFQFANKGDSGAALINAQGKLVGLVTDIVGQPPTRIALASHIHPVMDFLKVTPVTKAHPATGNPAFATGRASAPVLRPGVQPSLVPALRGRLAQTSEGSQLLSLIETHVGEVLYLVNHQRRVKVTWHRNKGPQFLNEAVWNAHDATHLIPEEIEGVARETLLRRMAKALTDHGSAGLRSALLALEKLLPRLYQTGSLHDLLDSLAADGAGT